MLTKSPESIHSYLHPLQYTSAARMAFLTILESLEFSDDKKLLLPAYIGITDREGSGVYDPVQEAQTPYEFYSLDKKLSAIKGQLYNLISSGSYRALLVIHYFGFCQNDMAEIVSLCRQYNVILIEDCAHTMLSDTSYGRLGQLGDFSFYSIHKYLATQKGGCLRVNNHDYLFVLDRRSKTEPKVEVLDMVLRSDLEAIREKRRSNYFYLMNLIEGFKNIEIIYPVLPTGIAPHNLPIIVKDGKRESVYFEMIDDEMPVIALYYRMIGSIKKERFPDSIFVSENILNLPVHQDIQESDLDKVASSLKKALKK